MNTTEARAFEVSEADRELCRTLIRSGSRTFYVASMLLPARVRDPAYALYSFCRLADDAIDQPQTTATDALAMLRERLALAYAGRPADYPSDRALAETVVRFAIPRELLEALLEGFAWDADCRRYEDLSGVYAYSTRVAGTVGVMMSLLMGTRDPDALARACDLGVAMQLSNIARDVGEDARAGRLYLPLQWLREAGIDHAQWLQDPQFNDRLAPVVSRLLDVADELYRRAALGVAQLPPDCRPAIHAALRLYCEIGRQVQRRGFDSVSQRAVVSATRKAGLVMLALNDARRSGAPSGIAALGEAQYLIDAVESQRAAIAPLEAGETLPPWWNLNARLVRVIDLFERIERREMEAAARSAAAGPLGSRAE